MGKKRNKQNNLNPWLTAKGSDQKDPFLQVGESLMTHPSFKDLSYSSQITYILMCMAMNHAHHNGKLEFIFPRSVYSGKYGISNNAFDHAKKELVDHGFITYISGKNQRVSSKYKMSNSWKYWNKEFWNKVKGCPETGRPLSQNGTPNTVPTPNIEGQSPPKMNFKIFKNDENPHET